ncbi:MAG: beta-lactamase regulating signal transducer with metallopeptidase domain [Cyclobacteriaceae bacterium]|jgi:beta-lactamase regulating signal transducer with metallopeptidase domain
MKIIITKTLLVLTLISLNSIVSIGQIEAPKNIEESFNGIMNEYGTWEIYKVVPVSRLEQFSQALVDTMKVKESRISSLENTIAVQGTQLDSAEQQIGRLKMSLAKSETTNDQITFMGVDFNKTGYHLMVWLIVAILFGLAVFAHLLFIRSNRSTNQSKKECNALMTELEDQRTISHEKHLKIKRELQTAVNLLTENGIRV